MKRGGLDHVKSPPRPWPLIFYPMTHDPINLHMQRTDCSCWHCPSTLCKVWVFIHCQLQGGTTSKLSYATWVFFMLYCKKQWWSYFLCHIPRSIDSHIVLVCIAKSKVNYSWYHIVRSNDNHKVVPSDTNQPMLLITKAITTKNAHIDNHKGTKCNHHCIKCNGQIFHVVSQGSNQWPQRHKAPTIKLIMTIAMLLMQQSYFYVEWFIAWSNNNHEGQHSWGTTIAWEEQKWLPCNNQLFMLLIVGISNTLIIAMKRQSARNAVGFSTNAIARNETMKFCSIIIESNDNKVAPRNNQRCWLQEQ